jgi:hypothetical protein
MIDAGRPPVEIAADWETPLQQFRRLRDTYLIYR